jgi:hypothetical protein
MPAVFRAVRALSNIDEADYMMSLAGTENRRVTQLCADRGFLNLQTHIYPFHCYEQATSTILSSSQTRNPDSSSSTRTTGVT